MSVLHGRLTQSLAAEAGWFVVVVTCIVTLHPFP